MDEEPLPIATYAKVLAHLVCHREQPVDKVLVALGVTLDQLQRADAYFNERLVESHRLRKGILAMTFASAFAEARRQQGLFTADPAPTGILPATGPGEPQALPSYMTAPSPMPLPAVQSPPASLAQTSAPGTTEVPMMKSAAAAMPFRPAAPGTPAPAASASPASSAAPRSTPAPTGPGTGTAISQPEGPRLPDTPWDQARNRVGKLTLAHYAALTVELSRNPADLTPLYTRYGLSGPDDLRHVQAAFQAQMQFDASTRSQFEALVGRMRSMSGKRDA